MDNTIIDITGRGVESGSLAWSALGMGGRSDVGDLTPSSSSSVINLDRIFGRVQEARPDSRRS